MSTQNNIDNKDANGTVYISSSDVKAAMEFWNAFKIDMPKNLKNAFEAFCKSENAENQNNLRYFLLKYIMTSDEAIFQDPLFIQIKQELGDAANLAIFDHEIQETLSE